MRNSVLEGFRHRRLVVIQANIVNFVNNNICLQIKCPGPHYDLGTMPRD